ncbi:MAG: hypothetical protein H0T79_13980, partial [Deltaproteobacteria bacterium]|nr:hypothetical protein [Deltaproteobacteria bacterium]
MACLLGVSGCITPSIPIPPPDPALMTFDVQTELGTAVFAYGPEDNYADAVVFIYNRDKGVGIIETART